MALRVELDAVEEAIVRMVVTLYAPLIKKDTPMAEVRGILKEAGVMYGRLIATAVHEGPIDSSMLMMMRTAEQEGVERMERRAHLFMPGGTIRNLWEDD